jgi:hypothetical protein
LQGVNIAGGEQTLQGVNIAGDEHWEAEHSPQHCDDALVSFVLEALQRREIRAPRVAKWLDMYSPSKRR